jgi:DnaJ family protein A protein 5
MGKYSFETPHLVYMPHCPRPLYEAVIAENFSPDTRYVILGNDLRDYLPDGGLQPAISEFTKPKKKRRDKPAYKPRETVLSRTGELDGNT